MPKRLTYEYVKEYIENEGYELLSNDYVNAHEKLLIKCKQGHEFNMNFNNFKSGKRCPICDRLKKRLTYKKVKNEIEKEGHKLLSDTYVNSSTPLKIKCPNSHVYIRSYNYFRNDCRCSICKEKEIKDKKLKRFNEVKNYIESFNYKLLSKEYINNRTKLQIECNKGHIYFVTLDDFQRGNRCPYCSSPKGEKRIIDICNKLKIKYIPKYKIKDCKYKNILTFDGYFPQYNILIEYDGIQHFEIVKHFGGFDGFIDRKIRDTIKNIYCKNNNIELLRIPYWDYDNIENIIINNLNLSNELIV